MSEEKDFKQSLCADIDDFSLQVAARCGADDRQALEQLCRYITRPALANEGLQTNATGRVELALKAPWRDGTSPPMMSPLECLQRRAALVPQPRVQAPMSSRPRPRRFQVCQPSPASTPTLRSRP